MMQRLKIMHQIVLLYPGKRMQVTADKCALGAVNVFFCFGNKFFQIHSNPNVPINTKLSTQVVVGKRESSVKKKGKGKKISQGKYIAFRGKTFEL